MLTSEELRIALENNLKDWPWDIRPSYPLSEEEATLILRLLKENN